MKRSQCLAGGMGTLRGGLLLGALAILAMAGHAQAQMSVAVDSQTSHDTWVYFETAGQAVSGTYYSISQDEMVSIPATAIGNTNGIQLSDVRVDATTGKPTFYVTEYNGPIYFSYGQINFENGNPSPKDTSADGIGNFNTRWQTVEATITTSGAASGVNANQTMIDYFSIPMVIEALTAPGTKASGIPSNNQFSSTTDVIVQALAGSTDTPNSFENIYNSGTPTGGPIVHPTSLPDANFVRAASPTQAPELYHNWDRYLAALAPYDADTNPDGGTFNPAGTSIHIADSYVGSEAGEGAAFDAQYFDLTATVSPTDFSVTITGNTYTDSSMTETVIENLTLTLTRDALNDPQGIYGNNAEFNWTSDTAIATATNETPATSGTETAGANDVLGTIAGDLLAGLSLGFPGTTFGDANASGVWWENPNMAFQQSDPDFMNTWAEALFELTSSYAIAYEDRFGQNLLAFANGEYDGFNWDDGAYLQITLMGDVIPEPGTAMLLGIATLMLCGQRRKRQRC